MIEVDYRWECLKLSGFYRFIEDLRSDIESVRVKAACELLAGER